jgi:hypothetical protein
MIVNDVAFKVEREGIENEVAFNIRQENVAHIFSILRNQLYANKVLAVVREYSTNAYDAHIDAKVERPIEITLPTSFSPTFIVRDFGFGLSPDDVHNIFASYGASTKRNTNEQVGMLGLGSKSAFCYVNSFMIISRHNGTEYTYQAYIDETNVGKVALLSTKPTDETGLSIHININSAVDYSNFRSNCVSFFKNFNPIPKFLGDTLIANQIESARLVNPILEGGNWKMYRREYYGEGDLSVLMGNVLYPATLDSLDYETRKYIQNSRSHIILTANIGDVKPSASRENLEMDNKTKDFIINSISNIQGDIKNTIKESLEEKKSLWSKSIHKRHIDAQFMHIVNVSNLTQAIPTTFNEKKLKEYGINYVMMETSDKNYKKNSDIAPQEGHVLFIDNSNLKRNSIKPRIQSYCLQNNVAGFNTFKNARKFILSFESTQMAEEFKDQPDFEGATIVYLKDIPYIPAPKAKTVSGKKTINAQFYKLNPGLGKTNSDCWTAVDEVEDNAVYLPLEYFKSTSNYVQDPLYIRDYTHSINKFLIEHGEEPMSFYGVKKANLKNVPDTMQSFDDYVEEFKSLVMTRYTEEYNNWNTYYNLEGRWKALFFSNMNSFPEDIKNRLQKIQEDFYNLEKFTTLLYALRFDISEKPFDIKEEYIKKFPLLVPAINGNISLMADIIGKEL